MKKNKFLYNIKNIELFGNHGVYEAEIKKGQTFLITITYVSSKKNIKDDEINNTVDYASVILKVKEIFNLKRYNLLETLAYSIYVEIEKKFDFDNIHVCIKKKNPLMNKKINYISVTYPYE